MAIEKNSEGRLRELSLMARLAIALHCFEGCCKAWHLEAEAISEFLDYMWEWPVKMNGTDFPSWEAAAPDLVYYGLGDELPDGVKDRLTVCGVDEAVFRKLTTACVEIIWSSFWGACEDRGSMRFLQEVLSITRGLNVDPPPAEKFIESKFSDRQGWGTLLTVEARNRWRERSHAV